MKEIFIEAVKEITNEGRSTALLACLEEPNIMRTINIGDSGYLIYQADQSDGDIKLTKTFKSDFKKIAMKFPHFNDR